MVNFRDEIIDPGRESRVAGAVNCIGESNSIQQLNNKWGDNPKIVSVGRRLSGSLEQGLVMAPPRARMTNDRGFMHLFVLGIDRVAFLSIGINDVCLAMVQVLLRLNPFPVRTQRQGASASIGVF